MAPPAEEAQREYAYAIRTVRSNCDARHLCVGEPQSLVHPGVRRCLRARLRLWFSARRLALRSSRGDLVGGGRAPLVSGTAVKGLCGDGASPRLPYSSSEFIQPIKR